MKSSRTLLHIFLCTMALLWYAAADVIAGNLAPSDTQSAVSGVGDAATQTPAEPSPEQTPGTLTLAAHLLTSDASLDLGKAAANVPFRVNYPSFGPGHKVTLCWVGTTSYTPPFQTTAALSPLVSTSRKRR